MLDVMVIGPILAFIIVTLQQLHLVYSGWEVRTSKRRLFLARKPYFLDWVLLPLSILVPSAALAFLVPLTQKPWVAIAAACVVLVNLGLHARSSRYVLNRRSNHLLRGKRVICDLSAIVASEVKPEQFGMHRLSLLWKDRSAAMREYVLCRGDEGHLMQLQDRLHFFLTDGKHASPARLGALSDAGQANTPMPAVGRMVAVGSADLA